MAGSGRGVDVYWTMLSIFLQLKDFKIKSRKKGPFLWPYREGKSKNKYVENKMCLYMLAR
jgi:hypothetical protein